jgi:hypothetical protein
VRSLLIAAFAALLVASSPVPAEEHGRKKTAAAKKDKDKKDTGASCKAPAVGACASCAITCRPGRERDLWSRHVERRSLRPAAVVHVQVMG